MKQQNIVKFSNVEISNNLPLAVIAGPCQIESLDHTLFMAEQLVNITTKHKVPFVYKSSFDKANRTSHAGKRGIGLNNALAIFERLKQEFGCLIITDVHKEEQCAAVAPYVDILQIPAFLCRQTDLLEAAAKTGKAINVKKGQFLAPWDMKNVVGKLEHFGADQVMVTERGTCFGYNGLVSDMTGLKIMSDLGSPVIFDATHSVQKPGGLGGASGGQREYVDILARAAVAVGVAGVFMEVHQDPDNAPSDGPCMWRLDQFEQLLVTLKKYDELNPAKSKLHA
ncbi:MAG: 2-dehydro-3-deoxyphosphooctonate aldolase [Rickettsiaceae bacterium]|jgi:2-dehydro-3-deoxyphosphooctonate aldolase (KDO 8-P synthase)|nr:2-dehydro-3-deoxyphosphooctonate aldolase [Rickettsiaceae bacterium]